MVKSCCFFFCFVQLKVGPCSDHTGILFPESVGEILQLFLLDFSSAEALPNSGVNFSVPKRFGVCLPVRDTLYTKAESQAM